MKEIYEFRIYYDDAHLLFKHDEGRNIGTSVKVIQITKDDPRFFKIKEIRERLRRENKGGFFVGWQIKRQYLREEIENAKLFHVKIKKVFDPAGEECGTIYDESKACVICKANAVQIGHLKLRKGSLPKADIARTIADEVIISDKFSMIFKMRKLKGIILAPIILGNEISKSSQLITSLPNIELTKNTIAGGNPFETSDYSLATEINIEGYKVELKSEVHKCPLGHTIGVNLLSEPHVLNSQIIKDNDFFASEQKIGVRRGLLRQHPVYLCSPAFRKMVIEEKLTGFEFEVAHIDPEEIIS